MEPYPHPHPVKNLFDKLAYLAGVLNPVFTGHQLYVVWSTKEAAGLSLVAWTVFFLAAIIMMVIMMMLIIMILIITMSIRTMRSKRNGATSSTGT